MGVVLYKHLSASSDVAESLLLSTLESDLVQSPGLGLRLTGRKQVVSDPSAIFPEPKTSSWALQNGSELFLKALVILIVIGLIVAPFTAIPVAAAMPNCSGDICEPEDFCRADAYSPGSMVCDQSLAPVPTDRPFFGPEIPPHIN